MRLPRIVRWLPAMLLAGSWLGGASDVSVEARVQLLAGPSTFRLLDWELTNLGSHSGRLFSGLVGTPELSPLDREAASAYLLAEPAARSPHRARAEAAIERAVARTYARHGAGQTALFGSPFPPVLVSFTPPPNVLVVSPRHELRVVQSLLLRHVSVEEQERLERSADSSGVSSLVAPIGGLATYPAMVIEGSSPRETVSAVAHEWVHHYLAFYPLGAHYWSSAEARLLAETAADLVAGEVAGEALLDLGIAEPPRAATTQPTLQFRPFMRETRLEVERLLGAREVEDAEAYMRERREVLRANGYDIRKLNQAYFALYGSYGEGFAASPSSPVPDLLRRLRTQSPTLGVFLSQVRGVASVQQLRDVLGA